MTKSRYSIGEKNILLNFSKFFTSSNGSFWDRSITKGFLKALEKIDYGSMFVVTPDGQQYHFKGKIAGTESTLYLKDWRAIGAFALKGDTGFAEAYRDGWWESDNLSDLFIVGLKNTQALDTYLYGSIWGRLLMRFSYLFTRNSLKGSEKNIHAHYDLGNDFYSLWLDKSFTYSSALFLNENDTLEQAQKQKYHTILKQLHPSGNLLEIGCGWGGFAEEAVKTGDYNIKAITLSKEQAAFARQRLAGKADIIIEDYRLQKDRYDNIVSIEMFEAVGEEYWETYFQTVKNCLAKDGKAVIQTITIADEYFAAYRRGGDMIRTYIFPGGMLPCPKIFAEHVKKAGLKMTHQQDFGQDYAKTLHMWLIAFEEKLTKIKALGFDDAFIRIWRFYLTCCIASFSVERTNVMQVTLEHA